jgi:hypothetical protein
MTVQSLFRTLTFHGPNNGVELRLVAKRNIFQIHVLSRKSHKMFDSELSIIELSSV